MSQASAHAVSGDEDAAERAFTGRQSVLVNERAAGERARAERAPDELASGGLVSGELASDGVAGEAGRGALDRVLLVTLLLLLLYGGSSWKLDIPLKIACCSGILLPRARHSVVLWTFITVMIAFINGQNWFSIDNHKYLITYWSLCVTMAVAWPRMGAAIVRANAHTLIGACFSFAVLWKIMAGQYLDGSFLHHTFLTDSRVEVAAAVAGGLPLAELAANRSLESYLTTWPFEHPVVSLFSSDRLETAALLLSYWTLFIESLVALLWLIPAFRSSYVKDLALMAFILSTYGILPVVGFATILGVMGFSAASLGPVVGRRRVLAHAWLGVIGAAQLASIPWSAYVADLL